jgi:hypothetical protein
MQTNRNSNYVRFTEIQGLLFDNVVLDDVGFLKWDLWLWFGFLEIFGSDVKFFQPKSSYHLIFEVVLSFV